jgi:hypothetical protein
LAAVASPGALCGACGGVEGELRRGGACDLSGDASLARNTTGFLHGAAA